MGYKLLTPEEFTEAMKKTQRDHPEDEEAIHFEMDKLMVDQLVALGFGEGVRIFKNQAKFYA